MDEFLYIVNIAERLRVPLLGCTAEGQSEPKKDMIIFIDGFEGK